MQHDVQRVAFFSSPSPRSLSFSLSRFTLGFLSSAHFSRGSGGCSPHSSTVSRRLQVWSVVDSDPPCVAPPCHVSVRHVALFVQ